MPFLMWCTTYEAWDMVILYTDYKIMYAHIIMNYLYRQELNNIVCFS
jgi:hypothetical protein